MSSLPGNEKRCWCGSRRFTRFSEHYLKCSDCGTLVLEAMPRPEDLRVVNDDIDFYGKRYYEQHLQQCYGYPDIYRRVRQDLPERCLYWLQTLLKYKLSPGQALELGCGHGGFVAMMSWAGFEAIGLEMSPWVVDFARKAFEVPIVLGPIEEQDFEESSFDVIALMDVLEHFQDPVETMRRCVNLLKPDGILLIQTPRAPEEETYEDLVASNDRFLEQLKETEHLFLFSEKSVRRFFERFGCTQVYFEPALFEYDMFLVISKNEQRQHTVEEIASSLSLAASGRLIQAMLDLDTERKYQQTKWAEAEGDRAARFKVIEAQGQRLGELEAERNVLQAQLADIRQQFEVVEADRAARLKVIKHKVT